MKASVAIAPPPEADLDRVAALESRVETLTAQVAALLGEIAALKPKRAEPPPAGWITVKQASHLCGVPAPTLFRWARERRRIKAEKHHHRVLVDPKSLPAEKR